MSQPSPTWLRWAREIQALAQTGYHYSTGDTHHQPYRRLSESAAEIFASHTAMPVQEMTALFASQSVPATSRVDGRGAAFFDGRLLIFREAQESGWRLPVSAMRQRQRSLVELKLLG